MASNHEKDSNNKDSNNKGNTSNRGFASMDEDKQREIASKGGQAAHKQGVEAGRQSHKNREWFFKGKGASPFLSAS